EGRLRSGGLQAGVSRASRCRTARRSPACGGVCLSNRQIVPSRNRCKLQKTKGRGHFYSTLFAGADSAHRRSKFPLPAGAAAMSEKRQFHAIKGTRDILPPDSALWNSFEQTARNIFESYNFGEIRLPIFEETDLFARSIGAETDVVSKEMFTFESYGAGEPAEEGFRALRSQSLGLRPEATASVARAYIEHGMHTLPGNAKLYYVGPMFRRERPQKGRYRQFYQIGAEVLGQSDAPAIDADVLEMLLVLFQRAGLTGTTLYVNSIGCKECRPKYVERLREELRKVKDSLGPDSQRRIETNPLRVLDSKVPAEQDIIEKLPRIADHLCADCREHFAKLKEELNLRDIDFQENWRLVRGLDY